MVKKYYRDNRNHLDKLNEEIAIYDSEIEILNWNDLTLTEKKNCLIAEKELKEGKIISHEQLKKSLNL